MGIDCVHGAGPVCRWFETTIRISMPTTGYRFLLLVPDGHRWLNAAGIHLVYMDANGTYYQLYSDDRGVCRGRCDGIYLCHVA